MASVAYKLDTAEDRRAEQRHHGLVERATLSFRGADYMVPVINISSRGTQVESDIEPRLGESIVICFEGCTAIHAFVRWARDGKVGINFGCEMVLG